jgi:predicted TIM-barrel fold metal-dependent hydrolase
VTIPTAIDCDVHPTVPSLAALLPYLPDMWRDTVVRRGFDELVTNSYPTANPLTFRQDWRDETGKAGTSVEKLAAEALDPFGSRLAILNCLYGAQALFSEDLGAAFSTAINDWIAREWLDKDDRLRASIVVPTQNPERAVDEINRVAADKRFVQGGGRTGRFTPRRRSTACPSASTPAAHTAIPSRPSVGHLTTPRTTSTRHRASNPSSPA